MRTTITFQNSNPMTIWNMLAKKLGREPTHEEAKAEVRRVLENVLIDRAEQGKLPHQRKR